jgi:hypothetical protein
LRAATYGFRWDFDLPSSSSGLAPQPSFVMRCCCFRSAMARSALMARLEVQRKAGIRELFQYRTAPIRFYDIWIQKAASLRLKKTTLICFLFVDVRRKPRQSWCKQPCRRPWQTLRRRGIVSAAQHRPCPTSLS